MWTLRQAPETPHWRWMSADPCRLAFSTRQGGISEPPFDSLNLGLSTEDAPRAVTENRRRLLAALGLAPEQLVTAGQEHGVGVREVSEPGHVPGCDALVTRMPGLALAVTSADCMPILYRAGGAVAAAHSGWRGTDLGMPRAALEAVAGLAGVRHSMVDVHLGPCIRGCCYEVGADVSDRFPAAAVRVAADRRFLDLPTAARHALEEAGVPASRIHDTEACTACEPAWYFSHRRDHGRTGRLWGVAAVVSDA